MSQHDLLTFFYNKRVIENDDDYYCLDKIKKELKLKQADQNINLKLRQLVRYGFLEIDEHYIIQLITDGKKAKKQYRLSKDAVLKARDFL